MSKQCICKANFSLLKTLGQVARFLEHSDTGVQTFRTEHYYCREGTRKRHICVFRPQSSSDGLTVVSNSSIERAWFTNSRETVDQGLVDRRIAVMRIEEVLDRITTGDWSAYDPWLDRAEQWQVLAGESNFCEPSPLMLERANDLVIISGASSAGKTTMVRQLGHLPPCASRGYREDEVSWKDCADISKCEILAFGSPHKKQRKDGMEFYTTIFEQKETLFHFLSTVTKEWHFVLMKVVEEALQELPIGNKLFFAGGLDTAELFKAVFACRKEQGARPTIIYNMPAQLSSLERWYRKRGTKMWMMEKRLGYDIWNAETSLEKADYVNVLIRGDQSAFLDRIRVLELTRRWD